MTKISRNVCGSVYIYIYIPIRWRGVRQDQPAKTTPLTPFQQRNENIEGARVRQVENKDGMLLAWRGGGQSISG